MAEGAFIEKPITSNTNPEMRQNAKVLTLVGQAMELQQELDEKSRNIEIIEKINRTILNGLADIGKTYGIETVNIMPTINLEHAQFGSDNNMTVNQNMAENMVGQIRELFENLTEALKKEIDEKTKLNADYEKATIMLKEIQDEMKSYHKVLNDSDMDNSKKLDFLTEMVDSLNSDRADESVARECVSALKELLASNDQIESNIENLPHSVQLGVTRIVNKLGKTVSDSEFERMLELSSSEESEKCLTLDKRRCLLLLVRFVRSRVGCSNEELAEKLLKVMQTLDEDKIAEEKKRNFETTIFAPKKRKTDDSTEEENVAGVLKPSESQNILQEIQDEMRIHQRTQEDSDINNSKRLDILTEMVKSLECYGTDESVLRQCLSSLKELTGKGNKIDTDLDRLPQSIKSGLTRLVSKLGGAIPVSTFELMLGVDPESQELSTALDERICLQLLVRFVRDSGRCSTDDLVDRLLGIIASETVADRVNPTTIYVRSVEAEDPNTIMKTNECQTEAWKEVQKDVGHINEKLDRSDNWNIECLDKLNVLTKMVNAMFSFQPVGTVMLSCIKALKEMLKDGRVQYDFDKLPCSVWPGVSILVDKFGKSETWPEFASRLDVKQMHLIADKSREKLTTDTCLRTLVQYVKESNTKSNEELTDDLLMKTFHVVKK